jgi:hypothetical protein
VGLLWIKWKCHVEIRKSSVEAETPEGPEVAVGLIGSAAVRAYMSFLGRLPLFLDKVIKNSWVFHAK